METYETTVAVIKAQDLKAFDEKDLKLGKIKPEQVELRMSKFYHEHRNHGYVIFFHEGKYYSLKSRH